MFITIVNMAKRRRFARFIYRGKNRLVKEVRIDALCEMHRDLQIQEKNMLILRHPYLTVEQSQGHTKEIKVPIDYTSMNLQKRNEKFSKDLTWAETLFHLKVKDAWE